jgi:uncharacterized membrane protein YfcA
MTQLDVIRLSIAILGLFLAGIIKGATGLGYASCALPFLAMSLELKQAISLVMLPAMASNFLIICLTPHRTETLRRFWPLYVAAVPGIMTGIYFLMWVGQRVPTIGLGILIIVYSAYSVARPAFKIPKTLELPLQVPLGFINGFFTGLTGSQVLPFLPYVLGLHLDPDRTTQAINLAITVWSGVTLIALYQAGVASPALLAASVLALVPALLGIYAGSLLRSIMPARHYRLIVQVVLGFLGLSLIARQLY